MTKMELIGRIKAQLALNIETSHIHEMSVIGHVLDALGVVTRDALAVGNEVPLPGLGKLKLVIRESRVGRNPQTGEAITIPKHFRVAFQAGKVLKTNLND